MAIVYNADEIYGMGIEIEKNGKAFYHLASEKAGTAELAEFFGDLEKWEDGHVALFEKLRAELPAASETVFDPEGELPLYLKAAADSHVLLAGAGVGALIAGCKGPGEMLSLALRFEKDSVVVYTTMKNLVPQNLGKDTVDRLINEEIAHVSFLQKKLTALGD